MIDLDNLLEERQEIFLVLVLDNVSNGWQVKHWDQDGEQGNFSVQVFLLEL